MSSIFPMPAPVERVAGLLSPFRAEWYLCGGWAADAWLGRTSREHHDVDIAISHTDQRHVFECFKDWHLRGHDDNVAGDTNEMWDGRELTLPAHIHVGGDHDFEFMLNDIANGDWVFHPEPRIALPLGAATARTEWGVAALTPTAIAFYKAHHPTWQNEPVKLRPHDDADFQVLLPLLPAGERRWLRESIAAVHPDHPWLGRIVPG